MLLQEHFDVDSRLNLRPGELVVLRTRRGVEVGKVSAEPGTTRMRRDENTAGKVVRRVSPADRTWYQTQRTAIKVAKELKEARRLGREMELPCTFADVEHMLEEDRSVVYYVSEGRVDLGDLPKRLAEAVGHRVDFRQIGARDVARLSGDVGSCGEELCCKTFIVDFAPVSMKMAKNQGLGVDMQKISGMCGRLKCCLRYEDDLYTTLRETMPKNGQPVTVNGEEGWVVAANLLTQTCLVEIAGKREEMPVASIVYDPHMSEGQIRRWQREMREVKAAEYEARNQERDARKAAKDQQAKDRMARTSRNAAKAEGLDDSATDEAPEDDAEGMQIGFPPFDGAGDGTEGPNGASDVGPDGTDRRRQGGPRPPQQERRSREGAAGHAGPRRGDGQQRRGDGPRRDDRPRGDRPLSDGPRQERRRDAAAPNGEAAASNDGAIADGDPGDPNMGPRRSRGRRGGRGRGGQGGERQEGGNAPRESDAKGGTGQAERPGSAGPSGE